MKRYNIIYIIIAAVLVAACDTNPELGPVASGEMIPLNIDGSIKQVQTKATAQGFVDKDAVGLYAVNYSDNNTVAGTLLTSGNQADNVKYVFDEPNHKWVPVRPVYYKNINTHADLYLYYPYQSTVSDVNAANFEVQKDQSAAATASSLSGYEASDWMWGKGTDITPSESKVRVQLSHRLSAIQVTLAEGTGFESGEFAALDKGVILTGTTRKATLDFSTGTATPVGSAQLDGIVMCPQNDGSWRAVTIPQTVTAGTQLFAITIGGTTYTFRQNGEDVEYQAGKQMNVTLAINKKSPAGDYEIVLGSTQITDWTEDRNTHGGEARQYYVVNVETPGTLGDLIAAAGKNPDKIRNLKVTGSINGIDFSFMKNNMAILQALNLKECLVENNVIPSYAFSDKKSLAYFAFPETLQSIESYAFYQSNISGNQVIPEGVTSIGGYAFYNTQISRLSLPSTLTSIGDYAFSSNNYLTGELLLPESLTYIGRAAFYRCHFNGSLHLPDGLEYLGAGAFSSTGSFTGDLIIPDKITSLSSGAFYSTSFSGKLDLNNVTELKSGDIVFGGTFANCKFTGELVIPEGIADIPGTCFGGNRFTTIYCPSTLITIGETAFDENPQLETIHFQEGLISIGTRSFLGCFNLLSLDLPSTLQSIGQGAFYRCYYISSIVSRSLEPPTVLYEAFEGVPKDNFTVEVPSMSVLKYQSDSGWKDFKRIEAHYDFSISRSLVQALNGEYSRTLTLRVPADFDWSIQSKPEWVTVEPSSGTGKTDVTITVSEMSRTNDTFEVNEGSYNNPDYHYYKGRSDEVVFLLNDKDYTSVLTVEQYDSDYSDGEVLTLQTHSQGSGIDIVFTGDGYSARDIAKETFINNATDGYGHFFDIEPYNTYKQYFDVYAVVAMSDESGIGTVNTIIDTKFGSGSIALDVEKVLLWAKAADPNMNLSKSLVILLQNVSSTEGESYLYADGTALSCCPVSQKAYPYDFRGIIQHEAGGHGFGKLADESIGVNAFVNGHLCRTFHDHPQGDDDMGSKFGRMKSLGWYKNLSMSSDHNNVPWTHLIFHPNYSDRVDMFEGGYLHSRGIYRSEATSCMNNNVPYFSAISRQAIVERIMEYSGNTFSIEEFYQNDNAHFGPMTKAGNSDRTFGVDPGYSRATGHGPIFMGDHPNVQ